MSGVEQLVPTVEETVVETDPTTEEVETDAEADGETDQVETETQTDSEQTEETTEEEKPNGLDTSEDDGWAAREAKIIESVVAAVRQETAPKTEKKEETFLPRTPMQDLVNRWAKDRGWTAEQRAKNTANAETYDEAMAPVFDQIEKVHAVLLKDRIALNDRVRKFEYREFVGDYAEGGTRSEIEKRFPKDKLDALLDSGKADNYEEAAAMHAGANGKAYLKGIINKAKEEGRKEGLGQRKIQTTVVKPTGTQTDKNSQLFSIVNGKKVLNEDRVIEWKNGKDPVKRKIATETYDRHMASFGR